MDHPLDNAYDAYAAFLPIPWDGPENVPEWPDLRDMFNDKDYEQPPGPWDPADHPEWEASNRANQDLLGQFAEATAHDGYAAPVRTSADGTDPFEDSRAATAVASPPTTASRDPSSPAAACWKCIPTGTGSSVTPRITTSAR